MQYRRSRGAKNSGLPLTLPEFPHDGMFASPASDDENIHEGSPYDPGKGEFKRSRKDVCLRSADLCAGRRIDALCDRSLRLERRLDIRQWRKWRMPVRIIAKPCSSAALIISASRMDPRVE